MLSASEGAAKANKEHELTPLQQRFVEEYPKDCKKGPAARRAGCEPSNARQQGYEWYLNPHIRAAIDERMTALSMSADEAVKHVSDIAATRLNDFMVVNRVQGYQQRLATLQELADEKEGEIDFVLAFFNREGLHSEDAQKPFAEKLTKLRQQLLDYLLLLETHGPDALMLVNGAPVVMEVVELDLVKVAKAKRLGRIKKFKQGKDGLEVEMYDAHKALQDVLKLNGRFVTKVDHTTDGESLNAPDAARAALLSKLAEGQE